MRAPSLGTETSWPEAGLRRPDQPPRVLLDWQAAAAQPVARVGAKAAGLARAKAAGLPVLAGWVVPSDAAWPARAAAAGFTGRSAGACARLAVMSAEISPHLQAELEFAARALGRAVTVRSSTSLDDDNRWSGAFGTYLDVGPEDLGTAVRGCWASLFSRDVSERAAVSGVTVDAVAVAVIVQPMAQFSAGGTARLQTDGSVHGSVVDEGPAALLAGKVTGQDFVVHRAVIPAAAAQAGQGGTRQLAVIAALTREVRRRTGYDQIEWGWLDGRAVLLQCRIAAPRAAAALTPAARAAGSARLGSPARTGSRPSAPAAHTPRRPSPAAARTGSWLSIPAARTARRLAVVVGRFPGHLAEELILPWAAACSGLPGPAAACPQPRNADSDQTIRQIVTLCGELTSMAWEKPAPEAAAEARAVLRPLRCRLDPDALDQLSALRPVSPRAAARVLALVIGLGDELRRRGCSPRTNDIWRYPLTEVQRMLAGRPGHRYLRPASAPHWDGFLAEASLALGRRRGGTAAAPGLAAATPLFAAERQEFRPPADRRVLVVRRPLPMFAPLLWGAAGLVSTSGSPSAHLFDVARSLGVPAVTNCPLESDLAKTARVVAVDGYGGAAFVLEGGGRRGVPLRPPERH